MNPMKVGSGTGLQGKWRRQVEVDVLGEIYVYTITEMEPDSIQGEDHVNGILSRLTL
jgi:hypothetical protein